MYRIDSLLKSDQKLYHTRDLALLWGITNNNTLYTSIKRYIAKGILIPIQKGYYSTVPLVSVDPVRVGVGYLHSFAYVSAESVLSQQGVIFQHSDYITLISNRSLKFKLGRYSYWVRKLRDLSLYNDYGITQENGVFTASLERAVTDIQYFNPRYYFDNRKKINWVEVNKIKKEVYTI